MANNYTQASFIIEFPATVDRSRVQLAMEVIETMIGLVDPELDADDLAAKFSEHYPDDAEEAGPLVEQAAELLFETENEYLGFTWALQPGNRIWISTDESIDIESAVHCIQTLTKLVPEMQASAPWYATWANTCSKMRIDEFGGGGVVFDADHVEWTDSYSWVRRTKDNFKSIKAAKSVLRGDA
jgi:hypothetical protein